MNRRNESYVPLLCSYPDSEKINKVSEGAEAMFCRLLAKCDDEGNYHGSPKRLLGKLYTLRYENGTMTARKVARYCDELVTVALLTRYVVDTVTYIHINDCMKSLRKDVKPKVFFPKYEEILQVVDDKQLNENETARNESVTECSESVTPIQSNPIQSNPKYMSIFDEARKIFKGTKRGNKTEFDNFIKKHKDWREVLPLLKSAIENQIIWRQQDERYWKNFKTWINNRCWEEEHGTTQTKDTKNRAQCPENLRNTSFAFEGEHPEGSEISNE